MGPVIHSLRFRFAQKFKHFVATPLYMVDLIFLGLNDIGERLYEWLTDRNDVTVSALLTEKEQLSTVEQLQPDLIVSAGYRHIVPERILDIPELGAVNIHKSFLPYNRGMNPNVWSILNDDPAGVSIHYMTPDVDEGPIIDRRQVEVHPDDTALDLYERLEEAQFTQFTEVWPKIRDGNTDTIDQEDDHGSYHYKQEFVDLWELELDETTTVADIIDRLRALTFPPFRNAYFEKDGVRYFVEINIMSEEEDVAELDRNLPDYRD